VALAGAPVALLAAVSAALAALLAALLAADDPTLEALDAALLVASLVCEQPATTVTAIARPAATAVVRTDVTFMS
jgi:hypothetical protein